MDFVKSVKLCLFISLGFTHALYADVSLRI